MGVALKLSKRMERTASEESLEIPEEPKEDLVDEFGKENSKKENEDKTTRRGSSGINFSTAVKIARWMARAYGYVAKKRQAYLDKSLRLSSSDLNLPTSQCASRAPSRRSSFLDQTTGLTTHH